MKKSILILVIVFFGSFCINAQNDMMYVMKNGVVIIKQSIKPEDVDSIIFYPPAPNPTGTVADRDGNLYNTITIGVQTWMVENLRTTKYNDGTAIELVTDNTVWTDNYGNSACYCWYNNDEETYGNDYGALYNWWVVNTEKLCPTGWHVPSPEEWITLHNFIESNGGKLKEFGFTHWNSPNTGANNETGFTALPGGYRNVNGVFSELGTNGYWWNDRKYMGGPDLSYYGTLSYDSENVVQDKDLYSRSGLSVRCVKD
jgi:uncharacterized protein (TIGR02145 family)